VTQLLLGGADVNVADHELRTCLHLAASMGNLPLVQALQRSNAELNVKDRLGRTPLAEAVRGGHWLGQG
jgi:ankyrin repeat protein